MKERNAGRTNFGAGGRISRADRRVDGKVASIRDNHPIGVHVMETMVEDVAQHLNRVRNL